VLGQFRVQNSTLAELMASAALGAGSDMPCNSRTNPMVNTSFLSPVEP
jgi:hypothetical protein